MIKKLIIMLIVGMLSVGAFASGVNQYMSIENEGWDLAPEFTVGVEVLDSIGVTNWSFGADVSLYDENLLSLTTATEINLGLDLGRAWTIDVTDPGEDISMGLDFSFDETLRFEATNTVETLKLRALDTTLGISYFFGAARVWLNGLFEYKLTGSDIGKFIVTPTIGFSLN